MSDNPDDILNQWRSQPLAYGNPNPDQTDGNGFGQWYVDRQAQQAYAEEQAAYDQAQAQGNALAGQNPWADPMYAAAAQPGEQAAYDQAVATGQSQNLLDDPQYISALMGFPAGSSAPSGAAPPKVDQWSLPTTPPHPVTPTVPVVPTGIDYTGTGSQGGSGSGRYSAGAQAQQQAQFEAQLAQQKAQFDAQMAEKQREFDSQSHTEDEKLQFQKDTEANKQQFQKEQFDWAKQKWGDQYALEVKKQHDTTALDWNKTMEGYKNDPFAYAYAKQGETPGFGGAPGMMAIPDALKADFQAGGMLDAQGNLINQYGADRIANMHLASGQYENQTPYGQNTPPGGIPFMHGAAQYGGVQNAAGGQNPNIDYSSTGQPIDINQNPVPQIGVGGPTPQQLQFGVGGPTPQQPLPFQHGVGGPTPQQPPVFQHGVGGPTPQQPPAFQHGVGGPTPQWPPPFQHGVGGPTPQQPPAFQHGVGYDSQQPPPFQHGVGGPTPQQNQLTYGSGDPTSQMHGDFSWMWHDPANTGREWNFGQPTGKNFEWAQTPQDLMKQEQAGGTSGAWGGGTIDPNSWLSQHGYGNGGASQPAATPSPPPAQPVGSGTGAPPTGLPTAGGQGDVGAYDNLPQWMRNSGIGSQNGTAPGVANVQMWNKMDPTDQKFALSYVNNVKGVNPQDYLKQQKNLAPDAQVAAPTTFSEQG